MPRPKLDLTPNPDAPPGACRVRQGGEDCQNRALRALGVCHAHKRAIWRRGDLRLGDFAVPGAELAMAAALVARRTDGREGVCVVVQDGVPCARRPASRGVCGPHRILLTGLRRLDEIALPPQPLKYDLRVNPDAPPGVCRAIQNGTPCAEPARPSGLCRRHYAGVWQRPDLNVDDFRPPDPALSRQRAPAPGMCAVVEVSGDQRVVCQEPAVRRGLCARHARGLKREPVALSRVADPPRRRAEFRIKRAPKLGVCVVIEDDVGCTQQATSARRVCLDHINRLRSARKLRELTDRFLAERDQVERKPEHAVVAGFCVLQTNRVPCTNTPVRRGLCNPCITKIERLGLDYEALALPPEVHRVPVFERAPRLIKGVCVVVADGAACRSTVSARGVCRRHYKGLEYHGLLERIALGIDEHRHLPETPHVYLDKNVPIRFAMFEGFGVAPERSSIALVQAVLQGRVRASVSLDCVRAVYSHLGHRLARPAGEGGAGLTPEAAEQRARRYTGELFFGRGGLWNVLPWTEDAFAACALEGRLPELSLEDALEVHLFARAKAEHGAALFVTADQGILRYGEAVHPDRVVAAYHHVVRVGALRPARVPSESDEQPPLSGSGAR